MKTIALIQVPANITWCNNMKVFFYGLIVITLLYFNERMNEIENTLKFESSSTVRELIIDHQWEISQLKKRLDNAKLNHGV
jgi:hypothetical protein